MRIDDSDMTVVLDGVEDIKRFYLVAKYAEVHLEEEVLPMLVGDESDIGTVQGAYEMSKRLRTAAWISGGWGDV